MVLDPFSAVGLAANVVQFLEIACKLVDESHEIYESAQGMSVGNQQLEEIYGSLSQVCSRLKQSSASGTANGSTRTPEEQTLHVLATSCEETCHKLLGILNDLKVKNYAHRRWQSFRQALKTAMKKSAIEALCARIDEYRTQITNVLSIVLL